MAVGGLGSAQLVLGETVKTWTPVHTAVVSTLTMSSICEPTSSGAERWVGNVLKCVQSMVSKYLDD